MNNMGGKSHRIPTERTAVGVRYRRTTEGIRANWTSRWVRMQAAGIDENS